MCSDCIERKSSECEVRDTVFHNCVSDKVKIISNVDIASAFIVSGYGDNNFLYYHRIEQSYAILRVYDPKGYKCKKVS